MQATPQDVTNDGLANEAPQTCTCSQCGATLKTRVEWVAHRKAEHLGPPKTENVWVVWSEATSSCEGTFSHGGFATDGEALAFVWEVSGVRVRALDSKVSSPAPATRPRENRETRRPRARAPDDSDRPPRLCGCGCGDAVPPGKRGYVDDSHSNRARQRRFHKSDDGLGLRTVACSKCGERLRRKTRDGLCGFCRSSLTNVGPAPAREIRRDRLSDEFADLGFLDVDGTWVSFRSLGGRSYGRRRAVGAAA